MESVDERIWCKGCNRAVKGQEALVQHCLSKGPMCISAIDDAETRKDLQETWLRWEQAEADKARREHLEAEKKKEEAAVKRADEERTAKKADEKKADEKRTAKNEERTAKNEERTAKKTYEEKAVKKDKNASSGSGSGGDTISDVVRKHFITSDFNPLEDNELANEFCRVYQDIYMRGFSRGVLHERTSSASRSRSPHPPPPPPPAPRCVPPRQGHDDKGRSYSR